MEFAGVGLLRNQKFQSVAIGFVHWTPDRCCCKIAALRLQIDIQTSERQKVDEKKSDWITFLQKFQ